MMRYQLLILVAAVFVARIMPEKLVPNALIVILCLVLAWLCYVNDTVEK